MSRNFLFNECSSSASASINFPKEININEKKAPTDQSVELLQEMEQKALESIIAKVSCCENNNIKWEAYFSKILSLNFEPMGMLTLRIKINGNTHIRNIKLRTTMMKEITKCVEEFGTASLNSHQVSTRIQSLLLFEIGVVIAQCIAYGEMGDLSTTQDILFNMSEMGLTEFEVSKFEEELQKV